jgi:tRNA(Ile)-lysidine synthase
VALLDLLVHLEDERLNLVVAHLNHSLRGADSDGDEAFVADLAAGYQLPFLAERVDVTVLAEKCRLSLEEAGRRARYEFFARVANDHGAGSIAIAHHQDDQAETVLIRLLRGAGGAGLSAMARNSHPLLKRPLLPVTRCEIEQYLSARGLSYRTDATNADTAILRNSIRHELLPLLRRYNPKVSERLAATAEILASDEELLDQLTESTLAKLSQSDGSSVKLDLEKVAQEPKGLRLRLYRRAVAGVRGDLRRIALSHLEAIDRLVTSGPPNGKLNLPGDCFVSRSYGILNIRITAYEDEVGWEVAVEGEGTYPLPSGNTLIVQRIPPPPELDPGSRLVAYLDTNNAPFPWLLRNFIAGDRFTPLGMKGAQKVKALFINEKVPLEDRRRIPLLISGNRILWVAGVRMAEEARVTAASEGVLRVEILEFTP